MTLRHALMICGNAQNTFATQIVLGKHWLTAIQCWFLEIPVDKVESETQLHHKIHKLIHLQRKIFHAHMNFANQASLWNLLNLLLLYAKLIVQKQKRMHKKTLKKILPRKRILMALRTTGQTRQVAIHHQKNAGTQVITAIILFLTSTLPKSSVS